MTQAVTVTTYKCESCETEYQEEKVAKNCEEAHKLAKKIAPQIQKLQEVCPHPSTIFIRSVTYKDMGDGTQTDKYVRCKVCNLEFVQ